MSDKNVDLFEYDEIMKDGIEDDFHDVDVSDDLTNPNIPQTKGQDSKKSKKFKKQSNKKVKTITPKTIITMSVLPTIGGLILGLWGGLSLTDNSSTNQIASIKEVVPLYQEVDSVKDSQLDALTMQLSQLKSTKDNSVDIDANVEFFNTKIGSTVKDSLDGLMTTILNDNLTKTKEQRFESLKGYFAITEVAEGSVASETVESIQSRENLNAFLDNTSSLAIQLNQETVKSGNVFASILTMDSRGSIIYHVTVPVATKDGKLYNVLYLVKTNSMNKVISVSYEGYLTGNSDVKSYYDNLKSHLDGFVKSENGDDSNLSQNNTPATTTAETTTVDTTTSSAKTTSPTTTTKSQ